VILLIPRYRGSRGVERQGRRARRHWYLESSYIPCGGTNYLRNLCHHRCCDSCSSGCLDEVAHSGTTNAAGFIALHWIRGFEIWRSRNGCLEVRACAVIIPSYETIDFFSRSLRPLIVSLAPGQQRSLNKLKKMRTELQNELADVINTFGPKYYEDFDEVNHSHLAPVLG
jgi:hypothetical protein